MGANMLGLDNAATPMGLKAMHALQTLNPSLREAAAIEGASRWVFFRRVQWPLLMPTTLFVLVNAVINAFRMVDHIFILTRGGPDNGVQPGISGSASWASRRSSAVWSLFPF